MKEDMKKIDSYPDVLKVADLVNITGLCKQKCYELVNSKEIPSVRTGKNFLIYKPNFIKWLMNNEAS